MSWKFYPRRLELYEEGCSDGMIARILEVSRWKIYQWRHKRKLPANYSFPMNERTVSSEDIERARLELLLVALNGKFEEHQNCGECSHARGILRQYPEMLLESVDGWAKEKYLEFKRAENQ